MIGEQTSSVGLRPGQAGVVRTDDVAAGRLNDWQPF